MIRYKDFIVILKLNSAQYRFWNYERADEISYEGSNDDKNKQTKNMFFHITIDNLVCVTNHNIISEV